MGAETRTEQDCWTLEHDSLTLTIYRIAEVGEEGGFTLPEMWHFTICWEGPEQTFVVKYETQDFDSVYYTRFHCDDSARLQEALVTLLSEFKINRAWQANEGQWPSKKNCNAPLKVTTYPIWNSKGMPCTSKT